MEEAITSGGAESGEKPPEELRREAMNGLTIGLCCVGGGAVAQCCNDPELEGMLSLKTQSVAPLETQGMVKVVGDLQSFVDPSELSEF